MDRRRALNSSSPFPDPRDRHDASPHPPQAARTQRPRRRRAAAARRRLRAVRLLAARERGRQAPGERATEHEGERAGRGVHPGRLWSESRLLCKLATSRHMHPPRPATACDPPRQHTPSPDGLRRAPLPTMFRGLLAPSPRRRPRPPRPRRSVPRECQSAPRAAPAPRPAGSALRRRPDPLRGPAAGHPWRPPARVSPRPRRALAAVDPRCPAPAHLAHQRGRRAPAPRASPSRRAPARPAARHAAGEVTISRLASVGYYASSGADAGDVYLPFKHEAVQACYAAALRGSPAMVGWLIVNASIGGSGSVREIKTLESEGLSDALISCSIASARDVEPPETGLLEVPVYMRFR